MSDGVKFAQTEMKDFYDHVKAAGGKKVIGPGAVAIGPYLFNWYDGFFQGGGDKLIDAFSFHAYNAIT
jgi:hypothetical protein